MSRLVELFRMGGAPMYLILFAGLVASCLLLLFLVLHLLGKRVPAALWLLPPTALVGLGSLGRLWGQDRVSEAIAQTDPSDRIRITFAGTGEAMVPEMSALFMAAGLLCTAALALGAANFGRLFRHGRFSPSGAVSGGILLSGSVLVAALFSLDLESRAPFMYFFSLGTGLCGLALLMAAGMEREGEGREERASPLLIGALVLASAPCAFHAFFLLNRWDVFRRLAHLDPAPALVTLQKGMGLEESFLSMGLVAMAFVLAGVVAVFLHRRQTLGSVPVLLRGSLALACVALGALPPVLSAAQASSMLATANLSVLSELSREHPDLPVSRAVPHLFGTASDRALRRQGDTWVPVEGWFSSTRERSDSPDLLLVASASTPARSVLDLSGPKRTFFEILERYADQSSGLEAPWRALELRTLRFMVCWNEEPKGDPACVLEAGVLSLTEEAGLVQIARVDAGALTTLASVVPERVPWSLDEIAADSAFSKLIITPGAALDLQDLVNICEHRVPSKEIGALECVISRTPPTLRGEPPREDLSPSENPRVMGSVDRADIARVMRQNLGRVRACYERELTTSPSLSGKITVKFVISSDGGVSSASVASSTLGSEKVERCVVESVKGLRFPAPRGGGIAVVNYPFVFSPAE